MPEYMAETWIEQGGERAAAAARRAAQAASALTHEGTEIRYLRSTYLPEDEVCLHLFRASSPEPVAEALRRAEVVADRIVEAVEHSGPLEGGDDGRPDDEMEEKRT